MIFLKSRFSPFRNYLPIGSLNKYPLSFPLRNPLLTLQYSFVLKASQLLTRFVTLWIDVDTIFFQVWWSVIKISRNSIIPFDKNIKMLIWFFNMSFICYFCGPTCSCDYLFNFFLSIYLSIYLGSFLFVWLSVPYVSACPYLSVSHSNTHNTLANCLCIFW